MSTKQLYEKTSEGMKEVSPLVSIEDIYSKLSDTQLEALVSLFNHVKCEWKGSVSDTRRTVPLFLRRSGLFITYNNGTKYITEFFSAGADQITTEGWVKDSNWTSVPDEDYISAGVKPGVGTIGYEQLNDNLKQLFREKVNVTNFPDDEDIASVDNMLKLKDREADAAKFQSKGYVILRKNLRLVNGVVKNILTQKMVNEPNTIYEIRYDFELNEQEITIPEGCTLKFNGGNLTNGLIISNKTKIQNAPYIDKTANLKITGKVYDINNNEITHYKWEIINRKCKLYTTLIPWWDFLNDVENAYRIGVTDFHIVLHISSNNNTNFEVTDPYYYSDERFVNKILKYNLSTPCLKLHIDEGKPFGSAPYNTVSYIENTINYVKTLVSKYRELGLKFDKFWVSNEHINVTCNDDNNSADLWRTYLIDLKTWLQTNYNISCWASLQQPVLAMASYNDINISANFYPRISSFDDRYCSNVDTLNNLVSQINTYIASCPNNISYVISECGCNGIYKSLRLPEAYSLKGQKYLYIFDKFYSAIVEALNQCQIDEWVIWYGDAPSGLKGAQDLVYNILRKLL